VRAAEPLPDDPEPRGTGSGSPPRPIGRDVDADASVVDPADIAVDHERRAAVLAALQMLPIDQRTALVLVDMEGFSVEETATILECAPGTVKSRCSRARAKLLPLLLEHRPTHGQGNPPGARHVGSLDTTTGPGGEP
jgi:RNA polymerase sigma-70 factor, ECF subfamily